MNLQPSCLRTMSRTLDGDNPSRILTDLPCAECGYNLRYMSCDGRCPECNTPVVDSLDPKLLIFAERRWLVTVSYGMLTLVVAASLFCVLSLLASLLGWRWQITMVALGIALANVGIFLLTHRNKALSHGGLFNLLRLVLRLSSCCFLLWSIPFDGSFGLYAQRIDTAAIPFCLEGALTFTYLFMLARFVPSPGMRVFAGWVAACCVFWAAVMGATLLHVPRVGPRELQSWCESLLAGGAAFVALKSYLAVRHTLARNNNLSSTIDE